MKTHKIESFKVQSAEMADLAGLTERHLRRLAAQGFFPPPEGGLFDLGATCRGLTRYYSSRRPSSARQRLLEAQGRREERRNRIEGENCIARDHVDRTWEAIKVLFRQRSQAIGANIQAKAGVSELVLKAIDEEVLVALSEFDRPATE